MFIAEQELPSVIHEVAGKYPVSKAKAFEGTKSTSENKKVTIISLRTFFTVSKSAVQPASLTFTVEKNYSKCKRVFYLGIFKKIQGLLEDFNISAFFISIF